MTAHRDRGGFEFSFGPLSIRIGGSAEPDQPCFNVSQGIYEYEPIGLVPKRQRKAILRDNTETTGRLEALFTEIATTDAGLTLPPNSVRASMQSTRYAVDDIFKGIVAEHRRKHQRPVLVTLPNWAFWDLPLAGKAYSMQFAKATDEDSLVTNVEHALRHDTISCLLLTFPSSPLYFPVSGAAIARIDAVAAEHGTTLVFDDMYRNRLTGSDRKSLATFASQSPTYVVEGLAKRFGNNLLGNMTSVAHIRNPTYQFNEVIHGEDDNKGERFLRMLIPEVDAQTTEQLTQRNAAFDAALAESFPEARVTRPNPGFPFGRLDVPEAINATDLRHALHNRGLSAYFGGSFYPPGYQAPPAVKRALRISALSAETEHMAYAGKLIGDEMRRLQ